ncbi:MAG: hypothetical protein KGJ44_07860 [Betaproteobacteria bacterium]|nr:hypothetical protein [Betaproteobacteria bacterium]
MSLGRLSGAPILNAPFTATVALTLAAGESITDECARAELYNGDERINARDVRVQVLGDGTTRQVRVRTTARITEPLLTVYVEVGCGNQVSRRYTLFVDPLANTPPSVADAGEPVSIVPNVSSNEAPKPAGESTQSSGSIGARTARAGPTRAAAPSAQAAARPAPAARVHRAPVRRAEPPPAKSRLTLDMAPAPAYSTFQVSPELGQSIEVPDEARRRELRILRDALVAELDGQSDPGTFARRLDELQRTNQQLSAQLSAARDQARQEKAVRELIEAQRYSPGLVYTLIAAIVALLGALAWIGLRGRALSTSESVFGPDAAADAAPPAAADDESWHDAPARADGTHVTVLPGDDAYGRAVQDGFVDSIPVVRPSQVRSAAPPDTVPNRSVWGTALTPHEQVAVNEVADISQEAEFFMDIGEFDRAINLLEQNIDKEHDITPVPQLYLFDLYRKTGRREPYERLRNDFVRQFNALIPQWNEEPAGGRELADYGRAMERICREWRSRDIVATLESLLVDDTRGQRMGFDLPAYRDIIFLHGIAKQLASDDEGGDIGLDLGMATTVMAMRDTGSVDFVLPEGSESGERLTPPGSLSLDIDFSTLDVEPKVQPPGKAPKPPPGDAGH